MIAIIFILIFSSLRTITFGCDHLAIRTRTIRVRRREAEDVVEVRLMLHQEWELQVRPLFVVCRRRNLVGALMTKTRRMR